MMNKEEFGRHLYRLMINKGLTQSQFARKAGLQRSNISAYVTGKALPTPLNERKMAEALGMQPGELLPLGSRGIRDSSAPVIEIAEGSPKMTRLKIDVVVPHEVAIQIQQLIHER